MRTLSNEDDNLYPRRKTSRRKLRNRHQIALQSRHDTVHIYQDKNFVQSTVQERHRSSAQLSRRLHSTLFYGTRGVDGESARVDSSIYARLDETLAYITRGHLMAKTKTVVPVWHPDDAKELICKLTYDEFTLGYGVKSVTQRTITCGFLLTGLS